MTDETPAYQVEETESGYRVIGPGGRTVLASRDRGNAEHYAALLEEAYRAGYRDGYREARRARK